MCKTIVLDSYCNDITCMKRFDALKYPCDECYRKDCKEREYYEEKQVKSITKK